MTGRQRTGRVRQVFALPGNCRLDEGRQQWRQNHRENPDDQNQGVTTTITVAPHPPKEGHPGENIGKKSDHDNHPEHDRGDANIEVLDVSHFVSHHTLEFCVIHDLEESGGCCDRCVLGVATGRESVGSGVLDDVDLRHR